jgi:dTMP kinase
MTLKPRGTLIVFEGGDRCGKSTQVSALQSHLSSLKIPNTTLKFPDRTSSTGLVINSYLQKNTELSDEVVHLLFSANRLLVLI